MKRIVILAAFTFVIYTMGMNVAQAFQATVVKDCTAEVRCFCFCVYKNFGTPYESSEGKERKFMGALDGVFEFPGKCYSNTAWGPCTGRCTMRDKNDEGKTACDVCNELRRDDCNEVCLANIPYGKYPDLANTELGCD